MCVNTGLRKHWVREVAGAGWPEQLGGSSGLDYLRRRNSMEHSLCMSERRAGSCSLHLSSHQGGTVSHTGQHSPAGGRCCPHWRTNQEEPRAPHTELSGCGVGWAHLGDRQSQVHSQDI